MEDEDDEQDMDLIVCELWFHIILSTKDQNEWMDREWRAEFHEQLGKIVWSVGSYAGAVGGVEDHLHLLVRMRDSYSLNDFVKMVQQPSAEWARKHHEKDFAWDPDYSVLSLSPSDVPEVKRYIEEEVDRHLTMNLEQEIEALFKEPDPTDSEDEWP